MEIVRRKYGGRGGSRDGPEAGRRSLLAALHIAKKDMGWSDDYYRSLLESCFGISTAAALSEEQLRTLVAAIKNRGGTSGSNNSDEQLVALRTRVKIAASQLSNGDERLKGLCKSICGVESVGWCRDVPKMKRVLAILGNVLRKERAIGQAAEG
jgi:hypothetical protein